MLEQITFQRISLRAIKHFAPTFNGALPRIFFLNVSTKWHKILIRQCSALRASHSSMYTPRKISHTTADSVNMTALCLETAVR